MDFIEIGSNIDLYALIQTRLSEINKDLRDKGLSEYQRVQLLGEQKALSELILKWLSVAKKILETNDG